MTGMLSAAQRLAQLGDVPELLVAVRMRGAVRSFLWLTRSE